MTRNRITNALGVLAAIFCLAAVLTGFGRAAEGDGDDGDAPAVPLPTSQIVPAPVSGGTQPQAPARTQAPAAPAQPRDGDG